MRALAVLVLAGAMALGTALAGWWAVPALAAAAVLATRAMGATHAAVRRRATMGVALTAADAAMAAALAWAVLLAFDALGGRFAAVLAVVGGVFPVPAVVVLALTIALPALLAWGAGVLAEGALALAGARPTDAVTLPAPGPAARPDTSSAGPTAAATP